VYLNAYRGIFCIIKEGFLYWFIKEINTNYYIRFNICNFLEELIIINQTFDISDKYYISVMHLLEDRVLKMLKSMATLTFKNFQDKPCYVIIDGYCFLYNNKTLSYTGPVNPSSINNSFICKHEEIHNILPEPRIWSVMSKEIQDMVYGVSDDEDYYRGKDVYIYDQAYKSVEEYIRKHLIIFISIITFVPSDVANIVNKYLSFDLLEEPEEKSYYSPLSFPRTLSFK
jgi:hypothetical protein